ncbi:MAG: oxidative damage protection protein [Gammaproteobacteria bacterium]
MTRIIHCAKLKKDAPGLERAPYPGQLGQKIYETISEEAWQQWLEHQTMLINEFRLSMLDPKAREFLRTEMDKFLFGEGSAKPAGYTPTK